MVDLHYISVIEIALSKLSTILDSSISSRQQPDGPSSTDGPRLMDRESSVQWNYTIHFNDSLAINYKSGIFLRFTGPESRGLVFNPNPVHVHRAPLLDTSRRCLCRNQLFQPFLVFARRREVTFLCREQKQKRLGHEASPLLGPPSGTIYLTI